MWSVNGWMVSNLCNRQVSGEDGLMNRKMDE